MLDDRRTRPPRVLRSRTALAVLALLVVVAMAACEVPPGTQLSIVSATPGTNTPSIADGAVKSLVQIGNRIVAGGTFTTVNNPSGGTTSRSRVLAFDATTGAIDQGFAPTVDDEVDALLPGPTADTVYVAGAFTNVNGRRSKSLALLNLSDGSTVTSFVVPAMDGLVTDLAMAGGRLYLGGTFVHLNATTHAGLATLDPTTGAIDGYANQQFAGHHNYPQNGRAIAGVGVTKFAVTPDRSTMVAIGNFTSVDGMARDQIAMIDLTGGSSTVKADWNTTAYTPPCFANAYDSYTRGVQFSPDGSYFVVVTTGGYYKGSLSACDAAARFETSATGTDVRPTWIDQTGTDSLYSVALTGVAVYVGGHQRWLNNPYGQDSPGPGAVPRPGLAALDPRTGVPLAWNPGRNPRGHGAEALLATPQGLYVGSDTSYIGNYQYRRDRIAFFPLAGGTPFTLGDIGAIPGRVYLAGRLNAGPPGTSLDDLSYRDYGGGTAGPASTLSGTGMAWSQVRGAFMVSGVLYYGSADGHLYRRGFDGTNLGSATVIDPYDDPYWSNVATGSGSGTYRGAAGTFSGEIPNVTAMAYFNGVLYYTLLGDPTLHARGLDLLSGVVSATRADIPGQVDWSNVSGMFLGNGYLYYASRTDGSLRHVDGTLANPVTVSGPGVDGVDWRTRGLFVLAN